MLIVISNNPHWTSLLLKYVVYPHHILCGKLNTCTNILQYCKLYNTNHILPIDITDIYCVLRNKEILIQRGIKFCLSEIDTIDKLNDKKLFGEYMSNHFSENIPTIFDISFIDDVTYPAILKCRIGDHGQNMYIINSINEYIEIIKNMNVDDYILQEYIEGNVEYSIHILAFKGNIIKYLSKKYVHGSNSYIRGIQSKPLETITIETSDDVLHICSKIIKDLNFSGFCCPGYKISNNQIKIFEINPRIGSSLAYDKENFEKFLMAYANIVNIVNIV